MIDLTIRKSWLVMLISLVFVSYCGSKDEKTAQERPTPVARVAIVKGDVSIVDGQMVTPATNGLILNAGHIIRTGASSMAEIFVKDQGVVRLNENTEFGLTRIDANGTHVDQTKGTAAFFLKRLKQDSEFIVNTPTSVAAVRGTSFIVDVKGKSEASYVLFDGAIEVSNQKGESIILDQKGELSVTEKTKMSKEAIRPLSKESLTQLRKMAVFQKSEIEEYNSFIDDLQDTETLRMTREEGDINERLAEIKDRPSAQDNTRKATTADENTIRRNTEKDPLKIQPQKSFK
ncbi:MAG: FecR domain-containing protein [Leptonema sp. (in: Bacteria)]|nr:FecR domain-containing protein [Leptonema sp. (in: bacteria)]